MLNFRQVITTMLAILMSIFHSLYIYVFLTKELQLAESERFELPEPFSSIVFKTTAIDHSANSPYHLHGMLL